VKYVIDGGAKFALELRLKSGKASVKTNSCMKCNSSVGKLMEEMLTVQMRMTKRINLGKESTRD
jgi:hypothetical protein